MKKVGFLTRIWRILKLLKWLFQSAYRFRSLNGVSLVEREQVLQQAAREGLAVLNVQLQVSDRLPEKPNHLGLLVVANHVSWLDIMVICALYPCGFIAMKEILRWPILGKIIQNAGTVFIDRSNRKEIDPINVAIVAQLSGGGNVCFFPEARTSLGHTVLPLKAALFQSAVDSGAAVQALALRYYDEGSRTERVSFADVSLLVSLWKIVSIPNIQVKVDVAEPLLPDKDRDRFALKDKVESFLTSVVQSDSEMFGRLADE